jgi:DNA-3-methyladenine glycosylase II
MGASTIKPLTAASLARATHELASRDPVLGAIVERHGVPPLWDRAPGFPTLVHIVLEQQVSLASARAAFDRLAGAADPLTPERFLLFTDAELLTFGFSRQKTRYARLLAAAIADGSFDLDALARLDDGAAGQALLGQTGIGTWSAAIYLLMALRRPDVWPATDLALVVAVTEATGRPLRPTLLEMGVLAERWRPWRSVAARILWVDYLARRGRL